ncbi:MAG: homoserine kinase [Anaerolineaceae bacterium]|nr:homoserine kinase [Anaerolineaceae bacterium]
MTKSLFTVHTPASTANLGPAFDCIGLSLDLWNTYTFSLKDSEGGFLINGEGSKKLPKNKNNLIYQAAHKLTEHTGKHLPKNLLISCQNNIPIASGLGSSASAIIGGLVGARKLLDIEISDMELVQFAAQLEKHADNVSACFYGGLVLVSNRDGKFISKNLDIQPLLAIIAIPDYSLSTKEARNVLPTKIPYADAIFNLSHAINLVLTFQTGDYWNLRGAMEDRIHQPYRLQILPGAEKGIQAAQDAGAYGACLSGAGPGIIAFSDLEHTDAIIHAIRSAYKDESHEVRVLTLKTPSKGCFVT